MRPNDIDHHRSSNQDRRAPEARASGRERSGTSARNTAALYRGFENIVLNRDPRDCAPILSAICGVCHSDHHIASVRAVENAAGMTQYTNSYANETTSLPVNAVLARNVILGADWTYSHAAHILALAGPDYHLYGLLDALSQSIVVNSYADLLRVVIIPAQALMHQIITLWGGKAPHQRGSIPGGNPVKPTADVIENTLSRIATFRTTLDIAAPVIWNYLTANAALLIHPRPWIGELHLDGRVPGPHRLKRHEQHAIDNPPRCNTEPSTTPVPFDPTQIIEDTTFSWYNQPTPENVIGEQTPVPDKTNSCCVHLGESSKIQWPVLRVPGRSRESMSPACIPHSER